jgi:hypothetical protein
MKRLAWQIRCFFATLLGLRKHGIDGESNHAPDILDAEEIGMSKRGVYLSGDHAYYDGNELGAVYATYRLNLFLDYLRGDDKTKAEVVDKVINEELSKPRTHARLTGLGSLPE